MQDKLRDLVGLQPVDKLFQAYLSVWEELQKEELRTDGDVRKAKQLARLRAKLDARTTC